MIVNNVCYRYLLKEGKDRENANVFQFLRSIDVVYKYKRNKEIYNYWKIYLHIPFFVLALV